MVFQMVAVLISACSGKVEWDVRLLRYTEQNGGVWVSSSHSIASNPWGSIASGLSDGLITGPSRKNVDVAIKSPNGQ